MESTFRLLQDRWPAPLALVSILVLMESTFRPRCLTTWYLRNDCFNPCFNGINIQTLSKQYQDSTFQLVSILVLMESTFRQEELIGEGNLAFRFNPCFNGINIQTFAGDAGVPDLYACFNPCFNGINIQTTEADYWQSKRGQVSILVLMESTFRQIKNRTTQRTQASFNPCFNGINIQTM